MTTLRSRSIRSIVLALGVSLLACGTGCAESSVPDKTAAELQAAMRASQYKDQQIRAYEWQLAALSQHVRAMQAQYEATQRELAAKLEQATIATASYADKLKHEEDERQELAARLAVAEAKGGRGRPDDLRRLIASIEAQNARLVERIGRLEQKIEAHALDEKNAARRPLSPTPKERTVDGDIIDPWGFGARK